MDYVFIDSNETVRALLLSNPVLDNPLDLMVYCYCHQGSDRHDTPALRRVDYRDPNDSKTGRMIRHKVYARSFRENYWTTDVLIGG